MPKPSLPTPEDLKRFSLFTKLSSSLRGRILEIIRPKTVSKDTVLFYEGDPCQGFFLIKTGTVKLYKASSEGKEQTLYMAGAGDSFAEAAVFLRSSYPVNARVLRKSELYFVEKQAFLRLLKQDGELAVGLLGSMALRLKHLTRLVELLTLKEVKARLGHYLVDLALQSKPQTTEMVLRLPAAKQELAELLGMTKESFSRALRALEEDGLIEMLGKDVRLLDTARLKAL